MWAQIGRTHTQLKQSDQALAAYRKAIELAPEDVKYKTALDQHYIILGQLYLKEKQYDEAFATYALHSSSARNGPRRISRTWQSSPLNRS